MSNEGEGATAAFYSHDNFILGSNEPAAIFVQSDCCRSSIRVNIQDVAGNSHVCQLKSTKSEKEPSVALSTAGIVAVATIVVLLFVLAAAFGFILYIRHKRSVDLEEMRVTNT